MTAMDPTPSPYYPPRAPWYRTLREVWLGFLRGTRVDRFRTPGRIPLSGFLLGLAIPGHAFLSMRLPTYGWAVLLGWLGLAFACLAGLGTVWSGVGIGLLIFFHASSILFLIRPWFRDTSLWARLAISLFTAVALIQFVYIPVQHVAERFFCLPLQYAGRPIVVHPWGIPAKPRPGDWVAYRIEAGRFDAPNIRVHEGYGLGPILAVAGDTIEFGPDTVRVNGLISTHRDNMPTSGQLRLPRERCFIWPELRQVQRRGVAESSVKGTLLHLAEVPYENIIGRPYDRWFFRDQRLP